LLENHGALTLGTDLLNAYHKMETLEHTASIVWKAIQMGNLQVLPAGERDRLMELREKFHLAGRLTTCDATPMASSPHPASMTDRMPQGIDEERIREITQQVIAKLAKH